MPEQQQRSLDATEGEMFRLLVENVQDYAIFVVDPEGRVRSWNPGAERLLGYSESEIVGQLTAIFFSEEDVRAGVPQRDLEKAVETGSCKDDRWLVRKDGNRFWSVSTITPLWDEGHTLRGFANIMRDRTSQKLGDLALKDALDYAEGVVETVREPLLVLNGDLRVKTANRSFYETFRVSPEETEGRLVYHLGNHQWDIPSLRTLLEEILPQKTSFAGFEVEHRFGAIGQKVMLLNARRFTQEGNRTERILLAIEDITERRRAEDERREIETRFTSLVKNVKDHAIFTMDLDGHITSGNREAERILGYTEVELLGQAYTLIFTPQDIQDGIPGYELRMARETGRGVNERWHIRKGGERFWALGIVTPTYDASGTHTGYSKILRDMTEQKLAGEGLQRAHEAAETQVLERTAELKATSEELRTEIIQRKVNEAALSESEERFQELTAHIDQVLWVMDTQEPRIIYVSPGYEKLWGRSCQSLLDNLLSYTDGIHPADQKMVLRENAVMFQTGFIDVECRVLRPDASVRWVWIRGYPVKEQDRIVRVVGVIEDITDKRLLAMHRDALLSRLQLHIERMPLVYILLDEKMRISDWNPAAQRIFGYDRSEALGKSPFDLIQSSFRMEAEEVLQHIRDGDRESHSVHENVTRDGRKITCEWFNTPLFEENGQFAGILCMAQNVTERKVLEEQFRQAQKMEAFGQLAGGVAHDFNNLLTIISGYSEILLSTLRPDDRNRGPIQEIHKAGERAALLTRQLLAFSRKQVIQPQILDINAVVASSEKMLGRLIGEDVNLTTVLSPVLGRVTIDPGQVEQVIMNLVVNSRDAMPQGGRITIETSNVDLDVNSGKFHAEVKPGHYVQLAVSDTGCGMTEEVQRRIFEPFFTTKEPGKGTGLGLATVFGIVKQSGGHVWLYSEVGRGTTFKIYLPSVEEVAVPGRTQEGPAPVLTGTETILLVEDEKPVRLLTRLALQRNGYTVLEAADGSEAIRLCEQHLETIHLLVSDVVMPEMGGRQLAERLTALHPEMRVLFVSGYTDDAVVRHGVLQAEVAFLQKPFSMNALHRKVRAVLDRAQ